MATHDIEVILTRQLASHLATPAFIVDPKGTLIFYNEPGEIILGRRFDEAGEMSVEEWSRLFVPADEHGTPLSQEELPLVITLTECRPSHRRFWIQGLDCVDRHIEVTALPLIGQSNQLRGAVALFWEISDE